MARITFRLLGISRVQRNLARAANNIERAAAGATFREAETVMAAAKVITPVDTGALRSSGHVLMPQLVGHTIRVVLGFGNTSVHYARIQHEDMFFRHAPGTQAKFLETPLLAASNGMDVRILAYMRNYLRWP